MSKKDEQKKVVVDRLVIAAVAAEKAMYDGFVCPPSQTSEFQCGWYACCRQFKNIAERRALNAAIVEARNSL